MASKPVMKNWKVGHRNSMSFNCDGLFTATERCESVQTPKGSPRVKTHWIRVKYVLIIEKLGISMEKILPLDIPLTVLCPSLDQQLWCKNWGETNWDKFDLNIASLPPFHLTREHQPLPEHSQVTKCREQILLDTNLFFDNLLGTFKIKWFPNQPSSVILGFTWFWDTPSYVD